MLASSGEVKIHDILTEYDIPFEEEYSFDDLTTSKGIPLRFDFAVFTDDGDLDFLIEFQGKQHYSPSPKFGGRKGLYRQQYNDNQKRRYCQQHNIKLIAIPYFDEAKLSYDYIMREAGY
jgi:hypothetical protein